jgi:hypothetical protein
VELTPEDRNRIYEEEKARAEAQGRIKAEQWQAAQAAVKAKQDADTKNSCLGCLGFVVVCAIFGVGLSYMLDSPPPSPPVAPVGREGTVDYAKAGADERAKAGPPVDHLKLAMALASKKDFQGAVDELDKAPDTDPNHAKIVEKREQYREMVADQKKAADKAELANFIENAKSGPSLREVIKDPSSHGGNAIDWKGRVMDISTESGETVVQVAYYSGGQSTGDNFVAHLEDSDGIFKDDWVEVAGEFEEMYDYESVAGYKMSSPKMKGRMIKKIRALSDY